MRLSCTTIDVFRFKTNRNTNSQIQRPSCHSHFKWETLTMAGTPQGIHVLLLLDWASLWSFTDFEHRSHERSAGSWDTTERRESRNEDLWIQLQAAGFVRSHSPEYWER
ncbi:hypothetical protein PoB_000354100 [Plakobranchus ocellatus]|uniref:Uncharacterized protein n=1 Tax=Plakobranchus ocellatus TaxID=259542 RepID=A0AAV3Y3Q5_9GAST|nr:hypothetical protein PoB_000354100 [Plakobranchus ocellatus]